jgi:hypothetical protein
MQDYGLTAIGDSNLGTKTPGTAPLASGILSYGEVKAPLISVSLKTIRFSSSILPSPGGLFNLAYQYSNVSTGWSISFAKYDREVL